MKCNFIHRVGFIFLALYLILIGVVAFVPSVTVPAEVAPALALLAGIFILIAKCMSCTSCSSKGK